MTLRTAWRLAQGRCECQREGHGHGDRCEERLLWNRRDLIGPGGWRARPWVAVEDGGADAPENCEIVCWRCAGANAVSPPA